MNSFLHFGKILNLEIQRLNMINPFTETYSKLATAELLQIINNAENYQPLAIEAAHLEIKKRNLTPEEIDEAIDIAEIERQKKLRQDQRINSITIKAQSVGYAFIDLVNPLQKELPSVDRLIKIAGIVLSAVFLYNFIHNFKLYFFTVTTSPFEILYYYPVVLTPLCVILFLHKQKLGWILLAFITASTSWSGFYVIMQRLQDLSSSLLSMFIGSLIYLCLLLRICKPDVRSVFKIENGEMILVICAAVLIMTLLLMVSIH